MGKTIYISTSISAEAHQGLKKVAQDREVQLQMLTKALLEWAGKQNAKTLIDLGVRLPVFQDELDGWHNKS